MSIFDPINKTKNKKIKFLMIFMFMISFMLFTIVIFNLDKIVQPKNKILAILVSMFPLTFSFLISGEGKRIKKFIRAWKRYKD